MIFKMAVVTTVITIITIMGKLERIVTISWMVVSAR